MKGERQMLKLDNIKQEIPGLRPVLADVRRSL